MNTYIEREDALVFLKNAMKELSENGLSSLIPKVNYTDKERMKKLIEKKIMSYLGVRIKSKKDKGTEAIIQATEDKELLSSAKKLLNLLNSNKQYFDEIFEEAYADFHKENAIAKLVVRSEINKIDISAKRKNIDINDRDAIKSMIKERIEQDTLQSDILQLFDSTFEEVYEEYISKKINDNQKKDEKTNKVTITDLVNKVQSTNRIDANVIVSSIKKEVEEKYPISKNNHEQSL